MLCDNCGKEKECKWSKGFGIDTCDVFELKDERR